MGTGGNVSEIPHYLAKELYDLVRSDSSIFDFLQAGSLDGIWYWDLENPENEWMSERFWEVFGYDPTSKEHKASEWQHMIHPDDLQTALENFNAHCADPNHPYDQLVRYTHKDGSTVWVRCRGIAIRDENGKPIRMLGAHNEVTEFKVATQQLERSNRQLEQFAYVASHDLQEPLRTIGSFLKLIEQRLEGRLDENETRYMGYVTDAARRMSDMVLGLLAFSRAQQQGLQPEWLDAREAVEVAALGLGARIEETGATIDLSGVSGQLYADRALIQQVFANLIGNALKFCKAETPRVEVTTRFERDRAFLAFRDNGIGFDQEHSERIFGFFARLHRIGQYPGSGIGLALCRDIVERHGGQISAMSAPGEGSTFTVELQGRAGQ